MPDQSASNLFSFPAGTRMIQTTHYCLTRQQMTQFTHTAWSLPARLWLAYCLTAQIQLHRTTLDQCRKLLNGLKD